MYVRQARYTRKYRWYCGEGCLSYSHAFYILLLSPDILLWAVIISSLAWLD